MQTRKRIPNALALLQQINLPTAEDSAINIATRLNFEAPSPSASPAPTAAKSASPAAPPVKTEPESIPGGTVIDVTGDAPPVGMHEPGAHKPQTNPGIKQTLKGAVSAAGAAIKSTMLHTRREAMKNRPGAELEAAVQGGASSSSLPNADALQQHVSTPVSKAGAQMGIDEYSREPNQANQAIYERREGQRGRSAERKDKKKDKKKDKGRSRSKSQQDSFSDDDL